VRQHDFSGAEDRAASRRGARRQFGATVGLDRGRSGRDRSRTTKTARLTRTQLIATIDRLFSLCPSLSFSFENYYRSRGCGSFRLQRPGSKKGSVLSWILEAWSQSSAVDQEILCSRDSALVKAEQTLHRWRYHCYVTITVIRVRAAQRRGAKNQWTSSLCRSSKQQERLVEFKSETVTRYPAPYPVLFTSTIRHASSTFL